MFENEDAASAALTDLLNRCRPALKVFCAICVPEVVLTESAIRSMMVETQYRTEQKRRIDILIQLDAFAIIVECKVNDKFKPYQLAHYRESWIDKWGATPYVVALLKKTQRILGPGSEFARVVTWNELRDAFSLKLAGSHLVGAFVKQLDDSGVTLRSSEKTERKKITKGYTQAHTERILLRIRDSIVGVVGAVHEVNECPPCLKAGRRSWASKFLWIERVWLYLNPVEKRANQVCRFGFHVHILLYHQGTRDTYSHVASRIPAWAKTCRDRGLNLMRNVKGKWHRREFLPEPFTTPTPKGLKWLTGYTGVDPDELVMDFDWTDEDGVIAAGIRLLETNLRLVDDFCS